MGLRMQPPNEEFFTLFSKASSNVVESAAILMEFAAVPHERWAELAKRMQGRGLLTDNASAYVSAAHALACRRRGIRHLRTRPYRPQTNGKAERFIPTLLQGWAYGAIYGSSRERTAALDGWLWHYNHRRRHSALGRQPPVSRTNVLGSYS